jgi:hypothetical protein
MITGVESPVPQTSAEDVAMNGESDGSSSTASSSQHTLDDDITPFPSPMLSATSLAGLSCACRAHY